MSRSASPEVEEGAHTCYVPRLKDPEDAIGGRKVDNLCEAFAPNRREAVNALYVEETGRMVHDHRKDAQRD
eukprot:CAMPEP_0171832280 /NCGR_PEP_ID=MMETSP0992-20121227/9235_1 /TAXON_ID=483369 /ORGANISM="non described non described, Strain CCMP2098" /LENGTH=70 /DNA_ID=CAMNT_0012447765 /DNA_START=1 /DNA_END=213 /DNA_ORIENTATION=+